MLIKYIRKPDIITAELDTTPLGYRARVKRVGGAPIGIIVATGAHQIGWSLCKKGDTFSKNLGRKIAIDRALICDAYLWGLDDILEKAPKSIQQDIIDIWNRSEKYYLKHGRTND